MTAPRLDSRTWLLWGLAAMAPALLTRNPWVLAEVLLVVLVVRSVWLSSAGTQGMGWFLRIAGVMILVSVVFNVLTVHAGDRIITELPGTWPIVGGAITWNALVYGLVSGLALFTLVLTGITVSTLITWIDLFHALPRRLAPIAMTGSVAWAFLPQTAVAWRQIREAQIMRGHRFRGVKDFVPIVVPLLAGGLERSLVMAEALEARGFGVPVKSGHPARSRIQELISGASLVIGLVGLAVAAYCLSVGMTWFSLVAFAIASVALAGVIRSGRESAIRQTRYRPSPWSRVDTLITGTSVAALTALFAWNLVRPEALAFRVYPEMTIPTVDIGLLLFLGLLMAPAFVLGQPGRSS